MSARIELSGHKFGRWTALQFSSPRAWLCRCDCGTMQLVDGGSLRAGRTAGCIRCNPGIGHLRKHGGCGSKLYRVWCGMKSRCHNPKHPAYPRYGGRGILVCGSWLGDFASFRDWAFASGYAEGLTIDRRNNDKGYDPSNCHWATHAQQNRNYSRVRMVEYKGKMTTVIDLAERFGIKPYTLRQRLFRMNWPLEKALTSTRR